MKTPSKTSFSLGLLNPNQVSTQRLSSGVYSMSSRSNVPFARLIGKGFDKTFSWGETVEVPCGQMASVANASYHAGDLYINSGNDPDNKPARITVPVPFTSLRTIDALDYAVPAYPADVRMARRAYLCLDLSTGASAKNVYVLGQRFDGSHNTTDEAITAGFVGAGYTNIIVYPAATTYGMIPLGHMEIAGSRSRPHTLLTTCLAYYQSAEIGGVNAYYTMEY